MKKKLFVVTVGLAVAMLGGVRRDAALAGGVPLSQLAGTFSFRNTGFVSICFSQTSGFDCSATDVQAFEQDFAAVGTLTRDKEGDYCGSVNQLVGAHGGDPTPTTPIVVFFAGHATAYDPATGTGDSSDTIYTGGHCDRANFVSTGATATNTETEHFAASEGGNRIDTVITGDTSTPPPNFVGYVTVSGESHRLNQEHNQH